MKPEDVLAPPCGCPECHQAGVQTLGQRRDPHSGRLLHGSALRRWHEEKAKFFAKARRAALGPKGPRGGGFTRLTVERVPGEDDDE